MLITWTPGAHAQDVSNEVDILEFVPAGGGGDVTQALTGQASTAAAGTLVPSSDVPAVGAESPCAAGTVGPSGTLACTGLEASTAHGAIVPSSDVPLVGTSATGATGTLTYVEISDRDAALTGQAVTCEQSVFGTMGGTYVQGGDGAGIRKPLRYAQTLVRQHVGPMRRRR